MVLRDGRGSDRYMGYKRGVVLFGVFFFLFRFEVFFFLKLESGVGVRG